MRIVADSEGCEIIYTGELFILLVYISLFIDTDSIILVHPRGRCPIPLGSFLGEMAQEFPDYEILEVVAAGPKQYAIKMKHKKDGSIKYIIKIRGITFDHRNENTMLYESFKTYVLNTFDPSYTNPLSKVLFNYTKFGPDQYSNILTRASSKYYRPVNTKGTIDNYVVYPYGFTK